MPKPKIRPLDNWYMTDAVARGVVDFARVHNQDVLEPHVGDGALVRALAALARRVTGADLNPDAKGLAEDGCLIGEVGVDFLLTTPPHADLQYGTVVMNPPFSNGDAERHIMHALKFAPRVIAHVPLSTLAGEGRRKRLWSVAHVRRMQIYGGRPRYSGTKGSGKLDMCNLEIVAGPRLAPCQIEVSWTAVPREKSK